MSERKFRVAMHTGASASVTVKLTDEEIQTYLDDTGLAAEGVTPETATPEHLRDLIDDRAFDDTPTLCAQCAGWGQTYGMDLGDWEPDDGTDAVVEVKK